MLFVKVCNGLTLRPKKSMGDVVLGLWTAECYHFYKNHFFRVKNDIVAQMAQKFIMYGLTEAVNKHTARQTVI